MPRRSTPGGPRRPPPPRPTTPPRGPCGESPPARPGRRPTTGAPAARDPSPRSSCPHTTLFDQGAGIEIEDAELHHLARPHDSFFRQQGLLPRRLAPQADDGEGPVAVGDDPVDLRPGDVEVLRHLL